MSDPFLAEIIMFGGNFAPRGWAFCNGQLLPISQNSALFSLLGTTYGGDGRTTFGLPDMRGRVPIHNGNSTGPGLTPRPLGSTSGTETNTMTSAQMPQHSHGVVLRGSDAPMTSNRPSAGVPAQGGSYAATADVNMGSVTSGATGAGQSQNNMQPFCTVNFIIAVQGLFPSRN